MNCPRTFLSAILFIFFVSTDQLSKYIIRFFGGFYICNEGIAFGINLPNWVTLGLIIAILVFIGFLILNLKLEFFNELEIIKFINLKLNSNLPANRQCFNPPASGKISNFPLILILSGAISNLIDRLHYGCVVDFIDLKIWPVFNLADIFICLGVFLLILKLNKK